jgi:hypothetical protein
MRRAAPKRLPAPQLPVFEAAQPLPLVAPVSVLQLARFRRFMVAEGWPVDLNRICLDRIYAFERLARAHTSADPRLRQLAMRLFTAYQSEGPVAWH